MTDSTSPWQQPGWLDSAHEWIHAELARKSIETEEAVSVFRLVGRRPDAEAGGALLAATADFRIAAEGPGTIGLPGVRLGIHLPRHCMEAIRSTVGEQTLTRWALVGDTMSFQEAREFGAIDRIVPQDRLLEEAVSFAEQLGGASSEVYTAIKRDMRGAAYERAQNVLPEGRKAFVDSWFSETGQRGLAALLDRRS